MVAATTIPMKIISITEIRLKRSLSISIGNSASTKILLADAVEHSHINMMSVPVRERQKYTAPGSSVVIAAKCSAARSFGERGTNFKNAASRRLPTTPPEKRSPERNKTSIPAAIGYSVESST